MNPEEGELRPQLLDRFGLCVDVAAPTDRRRPGRGRAPPPRLRRRRRRSGARRRPTTALRRRARAPAEPAAVGDDVLEAAQPAGRGGGRRGPARRPRLCRAAAALAGLDGRATATRRRRARGSPRWCWPTAPAAARSTRRCSRPSELERRHRRGARGAAPPDRTDPTTATRSTASAPDRPLPVDDGPSPAAPAARAAASSPAGARSLVPRRAGRRAARPVAALSTVRAARRAARRATRTPRWTRRDLRTDVRDDAGDPARSCCASTSAGRWARRERAAAATGAVLGLLVDAYQRRDRVALVTFRGDGAEVVLRPTASVEVARNRLDELPPAAPRRWPRHPRRRSTSPTAHAADAAAARRAHRRPGHRRAPTPSTTRSPPPATVRRRGIAAVVVDCEDGPVRLGLAAELADALGARHLPFADCGRRSRPRPRRVTSTERSHAPLAPPSSLAALVALVAACGDDDGRGRRAAHRPPRPSDGAPFPVTVDRRQR